MNAKIAKFTQLLFFTLALVLGTACSSDEEDEVYMYHIGIAGLNVSGSSFDYLSALQEAENAYEASFNLTGSKTVCDTEAKVKFTAAMILVKAAVEKVTDCSGSITYVLTSNGETIATEQITLSKQ